MKKLSNWQRNEEKTEEAAYWYLMFNSLDQVEDAINSSADANDKVRVGNLAMVSERETAYLRKMENEKNKHYVAECHSAERLTEGDMDKLKAVNDLLVQQKTPIR